MYRRTQIIWMLVLAVVMPWLADRAPIVKMFYQNSSSRLPKMSAWKAHKVVFADIIRNCEDFVVDEERGIAYFSCDPGRDRYNPVLGIMDDPLWKSGDIWYYEYAKHSYERPGRPQKVEISGWNDAQFHPLGLGFHHESRTLFVTNLAMPHSIEVLQLSQDGSKAAHKQTLRHPLLRTPNSIAPLSSSEILFTNDHKWPGSKHLALNLFENYASFPGGSVVHLDLNTNKGQVLAKVPFANGIVPLNKSHIAVASTTLPAILIYAMDPSTKALTVSKKLRLPFLVDNLHLDSNGHLLAAGHPHPLHTETIAKNNRKYNLDGDLNVKDLLPEKDRPRAGSWVVEWDGNEQGNLRNLYIGDEYGTACSASRDVKRSIGIMSGLYEKGILMWKE